ncbi:MAG: glutamate racemase [bacterium]
MKRKNNFGKASLPVGIFDSGIGGLTVLNEIKKVLPKENLIYLGDTARVPYGTKSPESVKKFSMEIAKFLVAKSVKLIVVACNTASATALNMLVKKINLPIIGVVKPGAEAALIKTRNKKIAVIGTEATIKSDAYKMMLVKLSDSPVKVYNKSCPLFVPLVEEGWLNNKVTFVIAREYLRNVKKEGVDTLILGCTHYPLLSKLIRKIVGSKIEIVDSARATSNEVKKVLMRNGLLNQSKKDGKISYYVTDNPSKFKNLAVLFSGNMIKQVSLVKLGV